MQTVAGEKPAKEGRVLVVDDEPMVRETLGQVLSEEGYVVDLAVDGETALERVHAARPDVILLDLMMPGMNGRQFLQTLREDPTYRELPVMIMTAVHGLEVNLAALGASEVVEKPFNVDELLNKVALAVYRAREDDPAGLNMQTPIHVPPPATTPDHERGIVLVVDHDRGRLQQLDMLLSDRGFTVVSMTRALVQLSRLARALRPRAILLDLRSDGVDEVLRELAENSAVGATPILVFTRDGAATCEGPFDVLGEVEDADLVNYVEKQR